jgi:hypothetical protein
MAVWLPIDEARTCSPWGGCRSAVHRLYRHGAPGLCHRGALAPGACSNERSEDRITFRNALQI